MYRDYRTVHRSGIKIHKDHHNTRIPVHFYQEYFLGRAMQVCRLFYWGRSDFLVATVRILTQTPNRS